MRFGASRRLNNANQILRDPGTRASDPDGARQDGCAGETAADSARFQQLESRRGIAPLGFVFLRGAAQRVILRSLIGFDAWPG